MAAARHAAQDNGGEKTGPPAPVSAELEVPGEQETYRELVRRRRSFYRLWLLIVGGMDLGVGLAYLTGPATSPNLMLLATIVPIPAWAAVFVAVGGLMLVGYRRGGRWIVAAGFAGAVIWLAWFGAVVMTIRLVPSGIGLPMYLGFATLHVAIVYGAVSGLLPTDRAARH